MDPDVIPNPSDDDKPGGGVSNAAVSCARGSLNDGCDLMQCG